MRRLLLMVSAIMLVDTTFYAALTPLLPQYAEDLGLSKSGAGLLTAAFGLGTLVGAIPAGVLATRFGVKPVVLLGLGLLASTSLAFAFAESILILDAARFLQGFGGACTWTASLAWLVGASPRERRGELIGTALGAAIAGALLGPVVGGAAAIAGTAPAFGLVALIALALALVVSAAEGVRPAESQTLGGALAKVREPRLLGGIWLVALPAMLFGALSVLAPLRLDVLGFGAVAIGATFLVSAGVEAAASPGIGRLSDRRGPFVLLQTGLVASAAATLALPWADAGWLLAALVVGCGLAFGTFWVPAMSLLSSGAEAVRLEQSFAFAFMNLAWAAGQATGSSLGGTFGEHFGDTVPYLVGASLCLVTLAVTLTHAGRPAYSQGA